MPSKNFPKTYGSVYWKKLVKRSFYSRLVEIFLQLFRLFHEVMLFPRNQKRQNSNDKNSHMSFRKTSAIPHQALSEPTPASKRTSQRLPLNLTKYPLKPYGIKIGIPSWSKRSPAEQVAFHCGQRPRWKVGSATAGSSIIHTYNNLIRLRRTDQFPIENPIRQLPDRV